MSPEVKCVLDLLQQSDWHGVLRAAEQLLMRGGLSVTELAHLNLAVCRAHLFQGNYLGGVPSGELARKLALDLQLWDLYGDTLVALCGGYVNSRQYSRALERAIEFLECMPRFDTMRRREGHVWFSIGRAQQLQGHLDEAAAAYGRAKLLLLQADGKSLWAFMGSYRHFECVIERDIKAALPLLREVETLAPAFPDGSLASMVAALARVRYHVARNHLKKALALGEEAMRRHARASDLPVVNLKALLSLQLASVTQQLGDNKNALGYALAARIYATQAIDYVTEFESVEFIYSLISNRGAEALRELDQEYLNLGIDLSDLVGKETVGTRSL